MYAYDPDNHELTKYNTKIMIATQNLIYETKLFCPDKAKLPPPPLSLCICTKYLQLPASN